MKKNAKKVEKARKAKELWKELLRQRPTNEDLRSIIDFVEPLKKQAGQQILKQQPTNKDLCLIIIKVRPLRKRAWQQLLKQGPTFEDLCSISIWVKSLKGEAENLLKTTRAKEEILKDMRRL